MADNGLELRDAPAPPAPGPPQTRASTSSDPTAAAAAGGSLESGSSNAPVRTHEYDDDDDADAADALLASTTQGKPRRARAPSFSVDFSGRLLQLAASTDTGTSAAERGERPGTVKEHVSLAGGIALVVGIVIGSGIFSSPGVVAKETGSVGTALLVWLGAGLLSWAGGSSFAELGSMLPMNGGHQVYLSAAFGPLCAPQPSQRSPTVPPDVLTMLPHPAEHPTRTRSAQ